MVVPKTPWYRSPNIKLFLADPLKELTRKERRTLLLMGSLGIVIAHTGLVPTQITALGIQFQTSQRTALYVIFALAVLYFLCAFMLYCTLDFVEWKRDARADRFSQEVEHLKAASEKPSDSRPLGSDAAVHAKVGDQYRVSPGRESQLWRIRCTFDMFLPCLLGVYSIIALSVQALRHR